MNMNLNISKREKVLLSILGIILVGFVYYNFIYCNLVNYVDKKTAEKQEIETKYNTAKATIDAMDNQRSRLKMLTAKVNDEAKPLYPTVSQEHIIVEIDDLIKQCNLEGGFEFDDVKLDSVPTFKKSEKDKGVLESSIQATADKYNNKFGDSKDKGNTKKDENNNSDSNAADNQQDSNSSSTADSSSNSTDNSNSTGKENKKNTVVYMEGKVKFYGTYENVVKFVKAMEEKDKKIALYGIGMDINDSEWVKGELGIGIYSIPKINDEISDYLKWTIDGTYGKAEPFQLNQPAGTGIQMDGNDSDFSISSRSSSSELPTVMIGRADDNLRTSYVYADGNNEQSAEIVFTQDGDNYYYKYKTANGSMPVDFKGKGNQFTPVGKNIVIDISSEERLSKNDKAGLNIKITNDTDKLIMVNVSGDDSDNPRISIDGDKSDITVNKK